MWPAMVKQGTGCQRHPTGLRFKTHQQCRLLWSVIINQIDTSICQGGTSYWKKFISEPLIRSAYNVNQNLAYHSCSQHDNNIHCSFVLPETSQMSMMTSSLLCQSRSHITDIRYYAQIFIDVDDSESILKIEKPFQTILWLSSGISFFHTPYGHWGCVKGK